MNLVTQRVLKAKATLYVNQLCFPLPYNPALTTQALSPPPLPACPPSCWRATSSAPRCPPPCPRKQHCAACGPAATKSAGHYQQVRGQTTPLLISNAEDKVYIINGSSMPLFCCRFVSAHYHDLAAGAAAAPLLHPCPHLRTWPQSHPYPHPAPTPFPPPHPQTPAPQVSRPSVS